jgi:hypothetical protein
MMAPVRRTLAAAWDNIGFVFIALALMFCLAHAFDPPRLNWGDSGSDFNVMGAGRNFQNHGFLGMRLTPHLLDPSVMTQEHDRVFIYTHYPQLPDLMNGVLRVVFRMDDLVQFRFVALAFSFAALFFIYQLIVAYWSRRTAQIGTALWVANPFWIQHADYLHHIPYGAFFGFGSVYFLVRYLRDDRRHVLLAVSGVFLFLTFLSSYDWWFFGPLLLAMVTLDHYRGLFRPQPMRVLGVLAGCAALAIAFKLATNAWALGGLDAWIQDIRFQFTERATDKITRTNYREGIWPTLYGRVERFFTLLLFPVAAFWAAFPVVRRRWGNVLPRFDGRIVNPGLLMLAALPFLFLFTEIWIAQYYPGMLVVPFYAVGSAAIAVLLWDSGQRAARIIAIVFVGALLANSVDENVTFKAAFFDKAAIATLGAQLATLSPPDKEVLVNHVFDAQYRYYFNRKIVAMALIPPGVADQAFESFANVRTHPRTSTAEGAVFVQHKHIVNEMYDKGYYYILSRYHLWPAWGNPRSHRAFIDGLMIERDSTLMAKVAKVGTKLYETDYYSIWRIPPPKPSLLGALSPKQ